MMWILQVLFIFILVCYGLSKIMQGFADAINEVNRNKKDGSL